MNHAFIRFSISTRLLIEYCNYNINDNINSLKEYLIKNYNNNKNAGSLNSLKLEVILLRIFHPRNGLFSRKYVFF